tara:strand:+ start:796 stop:1002 length:207 start_codon:yes stop_codon:yes gene_type:complete
MQVGSIIRDKRTGNLGAIIEVRNVNVIGIERLPVFSVIWRGDELVENVIGQQLLNERYEFVSQIKADT